MFTPSLMLLSKSSSTTPSRLARLVGSMPVRVGLEVVRSVVSCGPSMPSRLASTERPSHGAGVLVGVGAAGVFVGDSLGGDGGGPVHAVHLRKITRRQGVTQEPHPGCPFPEWVRIRGAFHALRRLVCRFTIGCPESFWRLRASAKRRSIL